MNLSTSSFDGICPFMREPNASCPISRRSMSITVKKRNQLGRENDGHA